MILRFNVRETHHLYYGIALICLAYFMSNLTLYAIGAWLVLDDLYQHWRQVKDEKYRSPVHRLYSKIYGFNVIRDLNTLADDLFGGRK